EDRERIAKELHDGVIQALFAVGMNLQATEAKAGDPEAVRARISGAVDSIDVAIRDLRNYIFGLRPGILADRQLDQALHQLADEFQEKSGVVTAVEIDERVAAQFGNSATQLVQVTREALSNVARHAQATTCRVSLLQHEDENMALVSSLPLRVMIVDDHEVVRNGVKALLEEAGGMSVAGEAATVREAIERAEWARPDVVVMDVRLADGSGIEATREIRAKLPKTQVLMLTTFADDEALF